MSKITKKHFFGLSLLKLLGVGVLVIGVIAGFNLIKRTAFLSTSALTPASVGLVETAVKDPVNGIYPVDINLRTGTSETNIEAISTVALKFTVSSKTGSTISLTDQDGNLVSEMTPGANFSQNSDFSFPVNKIDTTEKNIEAEFVSVNTSLNGYSTFNSERLMTFYVKGANSKEEIEIEFNKDVSSMFSKRRPVTNIW